MKILVLGSGGREHALCQTFQRQGHEVIAIPQNAGTAELAPKSPIDATQFSKLAQFAKSQKIDLTVAGPEKYLVDGIKDVFSKEGLKLFGPQKEATKLESSKSWAKKFMNQYNIPTAAFHICRTKEEAQNIIHQNFHKWSGVVIKPSGLTAGKGVMCCATLDDADEAIRVHFEEKRFGKASNEVIVEELLKGPECSLLAFCDGTSIVPMIPSQDHKRLWENDAGPNTGGVGAYAPVPFVGENILREIDQKIVQPTLTGLKQEQLIYQGIIYFGIMLTHRGPKVLEYNCRFGDPEAQVVLPLIESDLAQVMISCCDGTLGTQKINWKNQSACVVVMCSGGYPHAFQTGYLVEGLDELSNDKNIIVYHAGTKLNDVKQVVTSGGRVIGVTGLGDTLNDAVGHAYRGITQLAFIDAHYRRDIANQAIKECVT